MTKSIFGTLCEVFGFGGRRLDIFRVVPLFWGFVTQKCGPQAVRKRSASGPQRPKCGPQTQNAVRKPKMRYARGCFGRFGFCVPVFVFGGRLRSVSSCSTVFRGTTKKLQPKRAGRWRRGPRQAPDGEIHAPTNAGRREGQPRLPAAVAGSKFTRETSNFRYQNGFLLATFRLIIIMGCFFGCYDMSLCVYVYIYISVFFRYSVFDVACS
jgi:hypothetical protein